MLMILQHSLLCEYWIRCYLDLICRNSVQFVRSRLLDYQLWTKIFQLECWFLALAINVNPIPPGLFLEPLLANILYGAQ